MLTPLAFSCTPELLVPERGRKIGLLQVAKKALFPKLTAFKLDPPALAPTTASQLPSKDEASFFSAAFLDTYDISARHTQPTSKAYAFSSAQVPRPGDIRKPLSTTMSTPLLRIRPATSSDVSESTGTGSLGRASFAQPLLADTTDVHAARNKQTSSTSTSIVPLSLGTMLPESLSPFSELLRAEFHTPSDNDRENQGLSVIRMWDAKANPVSRPQKAVLLRPVTSRERSTTADQALATDCMLLPRQDGQKVLNILPRRPATAGPSLSSYTPNIALPLPKSRSRPRMTVPTPADKFLQSSIHLSSSSQRGTTAAPNSSTPQSLGSYSSRYAKEEVTGGPIESREQIRTRIDRPISQLPLSNVSNHCLPAPKASPSSPPIIRLEQSHDVPQTLTPKPISVKVKRPNTPNTLHEIRRKPVPNS